MLVKELIETLKKYNPESEIEIHMHCLGEGFSTGPLVDVDEDTAWVILEGEEY